MEQTNAEEMKVRNGLSVSFIVPVYNVPRKLLQRCLLSIIRATSVLKSYEIIVVDDGSDHFYSPASVVEQIAGAPICYVRNEVNEGLSVSRNIALNLSKKEYVQFVDADDFLIASNEQQLFSLCVDTRADLIAFRMKSVCTEDSDNTILTDIPKHSLQKLVCYDGTGPDYAAHHNLCASVCAYLFRRNLVADTLRFTPGLLREDEEFTTLLFLRTQHLVVTSIICYAYYQRSGSIMQTRSDKHVMRLLNDAMLTASKLSVLASHYQGMQAAMLCRKSAMLTSDILFNMMQWLPHYADFRKVYKRLQEQNLLPIKYMKNSDVKHRVFRFITSTLMGASLCWVIYRLYAFCFSKQSKR